MDGTRFWRTLMTGGTSLLLAASVALADGDEPVEPGTVESKPSTQVAASAGTAGSTASVGITTDGTEAEPADDGEVVCDWGSVDWSKIPPVVPMARPGAFSIPPTGPGYYSVWDHLTGNYRESPPPFPYIPFGLYPPSFFDSDFRFLEKPDAQWSPVFDPFKRIHIGDDLLLSTGGSFWTRYMNETNSRLLDTDNEYTLTRLRVYGDLWYRDFFRFYIEYLDANSGNEELAPLVIDENRSDLLNIFGDLKLGEINGKGAYLRGGRQELLYGSQRLLSTLDWANTRRTFEGVKAFWHGEQWDVDAFWVEPVVPDPKNFDHGDEERSFTGLWLTHRPQKGHFLDLYYLNLDQQANVALGRGGVPGDFNVSTIGTRYAGDCNHILWDFEAMYQFGDWSNQDHSAGAATAALGYHFAHLPMNPQLWVSFDWASGDENPGAGDTRSTFNQLFPFGHYYLGFLDRVGRQNIQDLEVQLVFYPTKWITSIVQFHTFRLDSEEDALYNAAGGVSRVDPTGAAGREVGEELDLRFNIHLDAHSELWFGYSKFFSGSFIDRTGADVDAELAYVMYIFRW
jgi:hypothetical protein